MKLEPAGTNLIRGEERASGSSTFHGVDPRTGDELQPAFTDATPTEVQEVAAAAAEAFIEFRDWSGARRAGLLRSVARELEHIGEQLVSVADRETALEVSPRLEGELDRTVDQLRAFARFVEDGWYVEAIIDTAEDGTPDVRRQLIGLGPVAVFGASNFPLAFGVAGGDTASALAAGCPVVVKAHPSHPATSEICARAVLRALDDTGAPPGTFSLIQGAANDVGQGLVVAPEIKAVGFTGSLAGGRALADLAAARDEPIPVFAEMGSLNPVFVLPVAGRIRPQKIASGFAASMTQGRGQFCTKPGLLFAPVPESKAIEAAVADELAGYESGPMLNTQIADAYRDDLEALHDTPGVETVVAGSDRGGLSCGATLFGSDLDTYLSSDVLRAEHFGPTSVVVHCPSDRLMEAAASIPGSLTATVHGESGDEDFARQLCKPLSERTGRIIYNGYPTGVAVVPAMHHGGPYPATTLASHTSVGMTAIRRFLRPIAYQDTPDVLLPAALRDANPLGILRLVDWTWTTKPVT